jgi:proliferating cell nuclear antigen
MIKIEQKKLATFIEIIRALVPECKMKVSEDGFYVLAVDTANVAMVSVRLPASAFEEYGDPGTDEIGMDMEKWGNVLKICKNSPVEIDPKGSKIAVYDGSYRYTITPLDTSTIRKWPNTPDLGLPGSITIDAKEYNEAVKAMAIVGDKVRLAIKGSILELLTEGDTDHLVKEIEGQDVEGAAAMPVSLFSIDYLRDTAKALKDAGTIRVHMNKDHPVRFDFEVEGMECSYLVAPRIEVD